MTLTCYDCGLIYGCRRWADFVVADDVWEQISPTGSGGGCGSGRITKKVRWAIGKLVRPKP